MLSTVVLGALALVPGIPLALVVGRVQRRWSGVVVDALLLGIVWYLLVAIVATWVGSYGRWQVALPTLALSAALGPAAWRAARRLERPQPTWFAGFVAALTVLAMAVRTEPFYFLYQIGDFGEYVNGANVLADGGPMSRWFTHGFTLALSLANLALGESRMVDLVPFLGIVLLLATVTVAERLGASRLARAAVGVILTVGVVPVWFSRFPASESLYAVLQLGMVLLVVEAVQRDTHRVAGCAGVLAGLMLVVRGNGLLLGPIVVAALLLGAIVVGRRTLAILSTFSITALIALGVAFVYDARYSYGYFIEHQLPKFVPDALFDQLEGMGGLRFAAPRLALLVAGCVGLWWVARVVNDRVGRSRTSPTSLTWLRRLALPAVALAFVVALVTVLDHAGLTDALSRYAVSVELLGAIGIVVALWRFADRMGDDERVGVLLVLLAGGTFAALFAHRIPQPRYAPYYLYWDRYLYSELFPLMVLAVIWAVWLLERWHVPAIALGAGIVVLGVVLHRDGELAREHRFMGDAYGELRDVAALTERELPIVFSGIDREDVPPELYHPNTHRVIGLPLGQTFDRVFLNIGIAPYDLDPQPTADEIADTLEAREIDVAYLMQVGVEDERPVRLRTGGRLDVDRVGETTVEIPMLDRPIDGTSPRWREARLVVVVSTLTVR